MAETKKKEEGPRSFTRALEMLSQGRIVDALSEKLFGLTRKLKEEALGRRASAAGSLTLTLKISVDEDGVATIVPETKVVEPKPRVERTIMFTTDAGNLTAKDPRQQELPLRDVSAPGKVRDIDDAEPRSAREV